MQRIHKLMGKILPYFLMILASAAIVYIAKDKTSTLDLRHIFQSIINNSWLALLAFALLIPNWLIETYKWKSLLQKYVPLGFFASLKSVLAGIGLSIVTPNRVGDFGGRVLYVGPKDRWVTFYITFLSSSSQLLATILMGSLGLMYFMEEILHSLVDYSIVAKVSLVVANIALVVLFFGIEKFRKIHLLLLPWLKGKINQLPRIGIFQKIRLILWSMLRYQIFAFQFIILIHLFGSNGDFLATYFALSIIYLFTSFLPTSFISEMPVRGSVAYYIFFYLGMDAEAALLSFVLMWVINLLVPSLFSLVLLKGLKLTSPTKLKIA